VLPREPPNRQYVNSGAIGAVPWQNGVIMELIRSGIRGSLDFSFRNKIVVALFALALFTRLPLMSISLDEVDAANFHNALTYGYNVPWLRPHPPGYPVYMFMRKTVVGGHTGRQWVGVRWYAALTTTPVHTGEHIEMMVAQSPH